jgi:hypothetical protein
MESEIKFPLSHPTHYIACLNNFDVTHVAVKLSRQMLWTMFLVLWIPKIVALLERQGIGRLTITRPGKSGQKSLFDKLGFYQYIGEDKIQPGDDRECSTDEDPYSCLTLGELASLGGFANEEVLQRKFKPIPQDEASAIGVTVCRTNTGMIFFKVLFEGEEYETDMFNVRLLIDKYIDLVHETSVKNVQEAKRHLMEKWSSDRRV